MSYLNSLLELEFSVVRDYNTEDRQALTELDIYRKIAKYNIYNRALKIFENDKDIKIFSEKYDRLSLRAYMEAPSGSTELFSFSTLYNTQNHNPNSYIAMHIGYINLTQIIESKELREKKLNRVINELNKLYDAINSWENKRKEAYDEWELRRLMKIAEFEELFTELDNRRELSDEEKRKIEVSTRLHKLLLKDYGLNDECFEELMVLPDSISFQHYVQHYIEKIRTHKRLILKKELKRPNLTITNDVKYL